MSLSDSAKISYETDQTDHLMSSRGSDKATANTSNTIFPFKSKSEHGKVLRGQSGARKLMKSLKRRPSFLSSKPKPCADTMESQSGSEKDDHCRNMNSSSISPLDSSSRNGMTKQKNRYDGTDATHLPISLLECIEDRDPVQARKAIFWLKLVEKQELEAEGNYPTNKKPTEPHEDRKFRECASITIEESDDDQCSFHLTAATQK